MTIHQFHDKGLGQLSYAVLSEKEVVVIDPARDPTRYYEFAENNEAKIIAVIETHPHADFISCHFEMNKSGAKICVSKLSNAKYPHHPFNQGDSLKVGNVVLRALDTPGHSPDSISVVLQEEGGNDYAVFTGDTLFVGDVGRPDLRESAGNSSAKKEVLAKQLYHSLRSKLMKLGDDVIVYPSHGAGSLCGKSMSKELSSTMGQQKNDNYALQEMTEDKFVSILLDNQPLVPKYFPYNVELNLRGAPPLKESLNKIKVSFNEQDLDSNNLIVDARAEKEFKEGHLIGAINIQDGDKFETWLGSIISPEERFYMVASSEDDLSAVLYKAAKIGYEANVISGLVKASFNLNKEDLINLKDFDEHVADYMIVDVREKSEVKDGKVFADSLNVPLSELRERANEIPTGRSIVVHCAAGYRSAMGFSILRRCLSQQVYDLGTHVEHYIRSATISKERTDS